MTSSARKLAPILLLLLFYWPGYGQRINKHGLSGGIDVGVGFRDGSYDPSITYYELTSLAKSKSFFVGWTGRLSAFYGNKMDYYTAPARLTRGVSGPGSLGKPVLPQNIDTLSFDRLSQTSLNLGIRAEYYLGRVTLGASADVLGVTLLGRSRIGHIDSSTGLFAVEDPPGQSVQKAFRGDDAYQQATPYRLNLISLGDLTRGMVTTEVYTRFRITEEFSIRVGYQWLTTEMVLKNADIVANNDRFRNRTGLLHIGLTVPISPW